jgi:hypothetical protein
MSTTYQLPRHGLVAMVARRENMTLGNRPLYRMTTDSDGAVNAGNLVNLACMAHKSSYITLVLRACYVRSTTYSNFNLDWTTIFT